MCIKVNADDFVVIHHELGHNYYQRAYNQQPFLYLNGAHDGFHEAIGDFIALSITPEYLVQIGLLDAAQVPSADKDIGLLLRQALDKVAFLPFGLLMDKWRWSVFSGETSPAEYQANWTALRRQYQGIVPPVERPATAFDPGAKYHIPGNTSRMPVIFWRAFSSFNSTKPPRNSPDGKVRCIAVPFMRTRRWARA
jgi:peptidyl-dipeptidase A